MLLLFYEKLESRQILLAITKKTSITHPFEEKNICSIIIKVYFFIFSYQHHVRYFSTPSRHLCRMEPLIIRNSKKYNNLFDCTASKTTVTATQLFNGNQQNRQQKQHSVSYLSSHQSHKTHIQQPAASEVISNAVLHQQPRNLLLSL
jgi:hypothetical protein